MTISSLPNDNKITLATEQNCANGKGTLNFRQRGAALSVVMCYFMVGINITLLAPSLSQIALDLNDLSNRQWIVTSYMIPYLGTMLICGKMVDIFGRRSVLIVATALFAFAPIASALAQNLATLAVARGVQGLGGGICATAPTIILDDLAPPGKRAQFQSMISLAMSLSNLIGPIIGGAFTEEISWRWMFWLNVILGSISLLMIVAFLQETVVMQEVSALHKLKRIDWLGTTTIFGFTSCMLCALSWIADYGWGSWRVIGSVVGAGLAILLLFVVETSVAREPIISSAILLNRSAFLYYVFAFIANLTAFTVLYYMSILFEVVYGASSLEAALRLIPSIAAMMVGSFATQFLFDKIQYIKLMLVIDITLYSIAYGLVQTLTPASSWAQQALYFMPAFFGISVRRTATIVGVTTTCTEELTATAISLTSFVSSLGFTLGLPIFELMFQTALTKEIDALDPVIKDMALSTMDADFDYFTIHRMGEDVPEPVVLVYMRTMLQVFIFPAAVGGVLLIVALLAKNIRYS